MSSDIPAEPVADALADFARQTGLQLVYVSQIVKTRASKGARAGLPAADALTQLLDGTGLGFAFLNERTVRIFESAAVAPTAQTSATDAMPHRVARRDGPRIGTASDIVVMGSRPPDSADAVATVQGSAASVSVVGGDRLEAQKLAQLTDYAADAPGLNVPNGGSVGQSAPNIRGIASLTNAASVTFYIDDTPVGPSGPYGEAFDLALDLLPYDLDRLEVWRGPQGPLTGAGSFGGVIRYVLKSPSASAFEARIGADVGTIYGAQRSGTAWRAMVNVPVIDDRLALRISSYDDRTPGYIDNIHSGAKDVNVLRQYGGRVAAMWLPAESLTVNVGAFWHRIEADSHSDTMSTGVTEVPGTGDAYILKPAGSYGDLVDANAFLQPFRKRIDLYSASIHWSPGSVEAVSLTGWSQTYTHFEWDLTELFGANYPLWSDGAVPAGLARNDTDLGLAKFTEEVRIASSYGRRLPWTVGGFFTRERATYQQALYAFDNAYQPIAFFAPALSFASGPSTFSELALFGYLTWKVTDQIDLTGGLRYARDDQEFTATNGGAVGEVYSVPGRSSERLTTWTATATYRVAPQVMFYGRVATGAQPGSPNGFVGGIPPTVQAETLTNYEAGLKSSLLDHRALIDLAVFDMDWNKVQINVPNGGVNFLANAGSAISRGMELTGSYSPVTGLTVGCNAAFTQAEFTRMHPDAAYVLTGYQLPNVPRWSLSLNSDYDWALANLWHASAGGSVRWVDREWSGAMQSRALGGTPTYELPSYSVVDLRAEVAKARVAFRVFARNLTDRRASLQTVGLWNPPDATPGPAFHLLQPRTVGIGIDYTF